MFVLASFNFGGPSEYEMLAALILAPIIGMYVGMLTKQPGKRWLAGASVGAGMCGLFLIVKQWDIPLAYMSTGVGCAAKRRLTQNRDND